MTKLTAWIAAAVLLPFGTALFAQYGSSGQLQQSPQQRMPSQQPKATQPEQKGTDWQWQMGKKATLTGCLTQSTVGALTGTVKKATSEEYLLKRQGTEQEITVKGSADLAQHKDHMMQISGTMDREDGKEFFRVSRIKHVANSCAEKTGLGNAPGKSQEKTQEKTKSTY